MKRDKEENVITDLPAEMIDNPDEQAVIQKIREMRAVAMGSKSIPRVLDQAGILCRGHRWHHSTV